MALEEVGTTTPSVDSEYTFDIIADEIVSKERQGLRKLTTDIFYSLSWRAVSSNAAPIFRPG